MGQKVNPIGVRLGIVQDWKSTWYADSKKYAAYLNSDLRLRKYLLKKYDSAAISRIQIERPAKNAHITICAGKPGIILGKKGGDIDALRKELAQMLGIPVHVNIEEIKKIDLDAKLVAGSIAQQLERRVVFRRAMKRAMQSVLKAGALGVKVHVSGRLGGAEIARAEWYREGRVPLHTFRADIDYGFAEAKTTYGVIGVKVWIFKGEKIGKEVLVEEAPTIAETKDEDMYSS
ncbi:MAG: 30S ribosomal protein S3 [Coxiellaceae bacterium]|jgi:small subunit ribosomal protein S3|nr:30S ribosomal protein S3 [Coxiellaceae bacterium]